MTKKKNQKKQTNKKQMGRFGYKLKETLSGVVACG